MAQFRWAYVNCAEDKAVKVAGPTGSLQFLDVDAVLTGSENLVYESGSATLFLTGTLLVSGTISASSFVINQTDTISGSTIFGNSGGDTHQITGSLFVGNELDPNGVRERAFQVLPLLRQSVTLGMRHTYRTVVSSGTTSSTGDYIIGFGGSGNIEFRLHSASVHNSGAILVLKDENSSRGASAVTVSASGGDTIDNNGAYVLTGSNPAISLYSNGANWFVF